MNSNSPGKESTRQRTNDVKNQYIEKRITKSANMKNNNIPKSAMKTKCLNQIKLKKKMRTFF